MLVTPHFAVEEFALREAQARRKDLDPSPYPPEWVEGRLRPLCALLERLRADLGGAPVAVLSGYRTADYNRAIGGAPHSQHVEGRAADVSVRGRTPEEVRDAAVRLGFRGVGVYDWGVHVDVREGPEARWDWRTR